MWRQIGLTVALIGILLAGLGVRRATNPTAPLLTDLQAPRGLIPLDDGSLLVAEVLGGRLLRLAPDGSIIVIANDLPATLSGPTSTYPTGISAAVLVDDTYYFIVGEFRGRRYSTLYRVKPGGTPVAVAGGVNRDGFPATPLTNPYDLVPAPDGGFFVSDGGANAVLYVTAAGEITEYAMFPRRENPEPGIHATIDVVPTGLTYGPDGALYLASFTGIPYPRGAAIVYRLEDTNGDGDALDAGETEVYAEGFSVATDVAFRDGILLVTEFSVNMPQLVSDYGLSQAARIPGRLVRWRNGAIETVAGGLVSPTSVALASGDIYVSEEFAGRVTRVRPRSESIAAWLPFAIEAAVAGVVLAAAVAGIVVNKGWR